MAQHEISKYVLSFKLITRKSQIIKQKSRICARHLCRLEQLSNRVNIDRVNQVKFQQKLAHIQDTGCYERLMGLKCELLVYNYRFFFKILVGNVLTTTLKKIGIITYLWNEVFWGKCGELKVHLTNHHPSQLDWSCSNLSGALLSYKIKYFFEPNTL